MRLALLDPALFIDHFTGVPPRSEQQVEADLNWASRTLQHGQLRIPDDELWGHLYGQVIAKFSAVWGKSIQVLGHLRLFRRSLIRLNCHTLPTRVSVWDFRTLLDPVGMRWADRYAITVSQLIEHGHEVFYIVRHLPGRNWLRYGNPPNGLTEKTIWNLRVMSGGVLHRCNCVRFPRNLDVPWTCRYDERLPGPEDGAPYPFCVPAGWYRRQIGSTQSTVSTYSGRSACVDASGRAWVKPDGNQAGDHWDVQIPRDQVARVGNDYLNITVAWPPKTGRKAPGTIDHGYKPPFERWACP